MDFFLLDLPFQRHCGWRKDSSAWAFPLLPCSPHPCALGAVKAKQTL